MNIAENIVEFGIFLGLLPISIFLHELGHALVALVLTKEPISIVMGGWIDSDSKILFSRQLGRVRLIIQLDSIGGFTLVRNLNDAPDSLQLLVILGGPIMSLVVSILCLVFIETIVDVSLIFTISVQSFFIFISSIIPSSSNPTIYQVTGVRNFKNDGQLLKEIINRR